MRERREDEGEVRGGRGGVGGTVKFCASNLGSRQNVQCVGVVFYSTICQYHILCSLQQQA